MNGDDSENEGRRDAGARADGRASGFAQSSSMSVHTLPEGTKLLDYRITGLLGEGGFGIVYLAFDEALQRRVALKEYLPSSMASRASQSMTVVLKSESHREAFALGLKSFVNEARLLARFDHRSLVKVYRFWEANGTAYMVMPFYEGPTLKRALADLGRAPTEAELRRWLSPLLDALSVLHAAQCFHRDIAPDNIVLTANGPVLLDFGAARRVIGDMTHALTVMLKPGFAPIEQYGDSPSMTQGAWTDIYALAAVVYAAITGHRPEPSVDRLLDDRLRPLAEIAAGRYAAPFLAAVDAALALRPQQRPQDIARFRALLDGREAPAPVPPAPAPAFDIDLGGVAVDGAALHDASNRRRRRIVYALLGLGTVFVAGIFGAGVLGYRFAFDHSVDAGSDSAPSPSPSPTPVVLEAAPVASVPVAAAPPPSPAPMPAPVPVAAPAEAAVVSPAPPPPPAAASRVAARAPANTRPPPSAPDRQSVPPPEVVERVRAKCSDILQKGSLEPLSASETAYLKKECQ